MSEDKVLCVNTQKNLNAGVFVNGELHPEMEKGPLHFQKTVREVVTAHHQKEKAAGHEIWPAHVNVSEVVTDTGATRSLYTAMDGCGKEDDVPGEALHGSLPPAVAV